ncbi:MAG: 3-methyl-2-oxobutanoate hydroxymethyltransferase [Gemmatimonas sp.]
MSSDASGLALHTTPSQERIAALRTRNASETPLVMLTAYDAVSARLVDQAGVDFVLVGDSAATTVLGYDFTYEIRLDELLMLTRAARRGVTAALLVGDLPHGTYEFSDDAAVATAQDFMRAGCDLVKLEGAGARLSRVRAIVAAGIPVVGHVGLLPQAARSPSDLRARGRSAEDAIAVLNDAQALQDAGCSALVIEAVPSIVASAIAARLSIPVIGIGAGSGVDGQVLVFHDMLGLSDGHIPKFVRQFANGAELIQNAVRQYARDVRQRTFPSQSEEYGMPLAERERFERGISSGLLGAGE